MKRRRVQVVSAVVVALVAAGAVGLWLRERPKALELSILEGVPVHEIRPARVGRFGPITLDVAVYYVEMDYVEALKSIDRELPGWMGPYGESMKLKGWQEEPGPFQTVGHMVSVRPNKCDPHTNEVYGTAADSKRWVTVCIYGDQPEPNIARGLWRAVTGNKRP